jgi:hypothetical protein
MGGSNDDSNLHMLSVWAGERWLMMLGVKFDGKDSEEGRE